MERFYQPNNGSVLLDNQPLVHYNHAWLRRRVAHWWGRSPCSTPAASAATSSLVRRIDIRPPIRPCCHNNNRQIMVKIIKWLRNRTQRPVECCCSGPGHLFKFRFFIFFSNFETTRARYRHNIRIYGIRKYEPGEELNSPVVSIRHHL